MSAAGRSPLARYGVAILTVAVVAVSVNLPRIGGGLGTLPFVAVFFVAWYGGLGAGLLATGLMSGLELVEQVFVSPPTNVIRVSRLLFFGIMGVIISLVIRSMDVARRRAEAATLRASEEGQKLRTTLQSIGDAVIVADSDGAVVSINPVAEALTGWCQREAEGKPLAEVFRIINQETRAGVEDPVAKVLREGVIVGLANHTLLIARDGTERPIDDSAAPIRDAGGLIRGVVLVFRDLTERHRAERQLDQAEARFRTFMDNSPLVAFIKDEDGRYVWGNASWGRLHPGGLDASLGRTDEDLWPSETARRFRESDRAALDSIGTVEAIDWSRSFDGTENHWMSLKFKIDDARGITLVGGLVVDVTSRIEAERALRESESRYRMLFASNPHPMWVFDAETLAFLAVNDAASRKYGYSREEFASMRITDIRPAEDEARLNDRLAALAKSPFLGESIWRHRKKDGTQIDVEIVSHSIHFEGRAARLVLANDVTDRRIAEEALRISRERLALVLDGARLGLWYYDIATGTNTLNDLARAHFGVGPDEQLTGEGFYRRLHPDDHEHTREAIRLAVEEARPFNLEYRLLDEQSRIRWIRVSGRVFLDEPGRPTRIDGISLDVTDQKEFEAELREAKEAAIEANQAKNKFLAVLGHELRTPLTPVLASVSALLDVPDGASPDGPIWSAADVRDTLAMIRRNVELETRLIGDLLDVSRVERGQLRLEIETVDMHETLRQSVEICRDEILVSGLRVGLELEAADHAVRGDHPRLMQIAWNLIHNAAKFSPSDARLTIRTLNRSDTADGGVGRMLIVEFEDTGIGVEPDILPRIFDAFEQGSTQARRRLGGLGLGLAISRSIAEAHDGRLTASSRGRGLGTTFRLELETIDRAATIAPEPVTVTPQPAQSDVSRILLVEDNVDTLRYLSILLRHRGFIVATATRIDEALTLAAAEPFDVMVSDIELPDGNGLELMAALRGKLVGVAVSGFGSDSDIQLSLDAGFSTHLTKPVDFARLEAAIRDAIGVSAG